ncbi:hypothetical protein [Aquimarina litoralis]|uniref:hypothetical protein n=1 Tax=Aquimarina litoralis TaxID=584605 RepID=UPI001C59D242|nr:hypothetical protein [Aquimarina litoralis]MBW1299043.1 hypothetical protein [Aquimarina litoralis]
MTEEEFLDIDQKTDKKHQNILIFFAVLAVCKYYFFDKILIGTDWKYNIFILYLPIILALIGLTIYRKDKILFVLRNNDPFYHKLLYFGSILMTGVITSFLVAYTISDFIFRIVNRYESENNEVKVVYVDIESYNRSKGRRSKNKIWFWYNNEYESFKTNKETIDLLENIPNNYLLQIDLKEGIWNHSTLVDWKMIKPK